MSDEAVDMAAERAKLEEAIADWPAYYQFVARTFQFSQPE